MIVITKADDLDKIKEKSVIPYIKNLLSNIQKAYCPDRSLESVGAIYFLENEKDLEDFKKFGLSSPICEERFEWIEEICNGYTDGCIVINNDFAINIIGKSKFFNKRSKEK